MSDAKQDPPGSILWRDLTVHDAEVVRDFYRRVVGWEAEPVEMGGYADFNMRPSGSAEPVAGVCHARGSNADLPAEWLIYITVADLDRSIAECQASGGEVVVAAKEMGGARYCVIRDPAGAVAALYQPAS